MNPAFVVRFRPAGPWRIGPDSGARNRVDCVFHSDTLFSAVSNAMALVGTLDEWLQATAQNPEGPAVRFSSLFPFIDDLLFVTPPKHLWPPAPSAKVRWKSARFVPLNAVSLLLAEKTIDENRWNVDGLSKCLLPASRSAGPFRTAVRAHSAVDRLTGRNETRRTACLEFAPNGGLWAVVTFANEEARDRWAEPVKAAFRLLADTGLGGERSLGWGRSEQPEFRDGAMPDLIYKLPEPAPVALPEGAEPSEQPAPKPAEIAWWLLSLFAPADNEAVDWQRGSYSVLTRGGRVESRARWGDEKKLLRMVEEGSVILAEAPPVGAAPDVAPDGFPHPVFRAGFAVAVPVPLRAQERPSVAPRESVAP